MKCGECGGKGCKDRPDCHGGHWEITTCPKLLITDDVWTLLKMARFAARGSWPIAGGVLDQAQCFLDACDFIWMEERVWRASLGMKLDE